MKKLISIFIILILSLSSVSAQENNRKDILRLKEIFGIDKEYSEFNISENQYENYDNIKFLSERAKGKVYYTYSWSDEKLGSVNIETSSDGEILNYSKYSNEKDDFNKNISFSIDRNKAKESVENLLKTIDNNFFNKYKLENVMLERNLSEISFEYTRFYNDIPFPEDTVSVLYSFNKNEVTEFSKVRGYNFILTFLKDEDFKFSKDIGLDKAKEISKKSQAFEEAYLVNNKNVSNLITIPNFKAIYAADGTFVKEDDIQNNLYKTEEAKEADSGAALTDVEIKTLDNIKNLKSKDEALKIAKEIFPKNSKLDKAVLHSNGENYFYFIKTTGEKNESNLELDATNLNLISYSTYNLDQKKTNKILDEKEVLSIATNFTKKYLKDSSIFLNKGIVDKNSVTFPRYVNNRYIIYEGVNISINPQTKKIEFFNYTKNSVKFPDGPFKLTKDQAENIFYSSACFMKKYVLFPTGVKLVYTTKSGENPTVNEDGLIVSPYGDIIDYKEQIHYPDIDKAKHKEILDNLKDMSVGLVNRKLRAPITYEDYINLTSYFRNPDYIDDYILSNYKIKREDLKKTIKEKELIRLAIDDSISRELLKADNIFRNDLFKNQKDLKDYEKYYILAKGFHLFDQEPNPESEITLEDALYIIYKSYSL